MPNQNTKDQIAAVMLQHGTEEQQQEALKYCGLTEATETPQGLLSNSSDLLSCAQCGADPRIYCEIKTWRGREPGDSGHATATCKKCGHLVTVSTALGLSIIRKIWDVRAV